MGLLFERYGQQLKLLTIKTEEAEDRLTQLLKKCGYSLYIKGHFIIYLIHYII